MTTTFKEGETSVMKTRDLVLLLVSKCQDSPEFGRTSLQKVAYFAGLALDRDLGHQAHYYGPFSSLVESEIDALALSDLLEESVTPLGFSSSSGFGVRKYQYRLTVDGERRVEDIVRVHPEESMVLGDLVDLLRDHAGGLDQSVLSPAAKVLYIAHQNQNRSVSTEEIALAGEDLGWQLDAARVERVARLLERLGFVELSESNRPLRFRPSP